MRTLRAAATLLAAVLLVPALAGTAHAGTHVVRTDDGTREDSIHVDTTYDVAYKYLWLEPETLAGTTAATLWAYARADGCDGVPAQTQEPFLNGYRLAAFDPCEKWPAGTYGWASFTVPVNRLVADRNWLSFFDTRLDNTTSHSSHHGIDTSVRGSSTTDSTPTGVVAKPGELMWYLELSGTAPAIAGSPDPLDFGITPAGTTRTVTVTGVGFAEARVTSVGVSGTHAAEFATSADTCTGARLAPGQSCTIAVTFTPATFTRRSATLTVSGPSVRTTVALTGEGRSAPPVSTITPRDVTVPRTEPLTGTVTDDLGVMREWVWFVSAVPAQSFGLLARLSCNTGATACTWAVDVRLVTPGRYTVTAHGTDVQGVVESPGATAEVLIV